MENNSQITIVVLQELPCFINDCHFAIFIGDDHIPHGRGRIAGNENPCILNVNLAPAIQSESFVVGEVGITAHKIGQRAFPCGAEGLGDCC